MNIFDPIRNKLVAATPEEILRQNLLQFMIKELAFPKSLLCVEKDLAQLPHLKEKKHLLPIRRVDLLCFAKDLHPEFPLYPLLIVECKACRLTEETEKQVVGYNHFVGSYFVAIAAEGQIKTFWYSEKLKKYDSVDFLPSYKQLLAALK